MDERVLQAIKKADLMAYRDVIEKLLEPAIHIETTRIEDPSTLEIGASRIGGQPDLPKQYEWPLWQDVPQDFLAQINLAELASCKIATPLPRSGWLYFFYNAQQCTWGLDPKDKGSFVVHYFDGSVQELQRRSPPECNPPKKSLLKLIISLDTDSPNYFPLCKVNCKPLLTLPDETPDVLDEFEDAYCDLMPEYLPKEFGIYEEPSHQMSGHPQPIQGDMRQECELVANGFDCDSSDAYIKADMELINKMSNEWVLLLQLDSDDDAGMMWGDLGMLYFMIRKQDLANREFDKVWMVMQCS